ncbi:hypothetical protein EVAR_50198_1 [Eumeta japonica]|uniref:Uncharacterized protein n=1 Tax=Eumeta variegata TaxID=151549 RepID=A0A4C1WYN8_EUMVA|nr:hypothetical protein EVAR_50198_1 [Eumeta japonica]
MPFVAAAAGARDIQFISLVSPCQVAPLNKMYLIQNTVTQNGSAPPQRRPLARRPPGCQRQSGGYRYRTATSLQGVYRDELQIIQLKGLCIELCTDQKTCCKLLLRLYHPEVSHKHHGESRVKASAPKAFTFVFEQNLSGVGGRPRADEPSRLRLVNHPSRKPRAFAWTDVTAHAPAAVYVRFLASNKLMWARRGGGALPDVTRAEFPQRHARPKQRTSCVCARSHRLSTLYGFRMHAERLYDSGDCKKGTASRLKLLNFQPLNSTTLQAMRQRHRRGARSQQILGHELDEEAFLRETIADNSRAGTPPPHVLSSSSSASLRWLRASVGCGWPEIVPHEDLERPMSSSGRPTTEKI